MSAVANSLLCCFCLIGQTELTGEVTPSQVLPLEAGEVSLELDLSRGGGIRTLRYQSVDIVSTQHDRPTIFAIDVVRGQRVRRFDNRDFSSFRHEKIPEGVRLVYSGLPETVLEIELIIRAKGNYLAFQSEVSCGAETVCATFEYPYISGYESLSGDPTKDHYIVPHLGGQDLVDPTKVRRNAPEAFSRQGYPGTQGMQFHALHNELGGLVMYAADNECHPKLFGLHFDQERDCIAWSLRHYFNETPGFTLTQDYEVRIQGCGPTWYDAADVYAEWSRKQWWMEKKVKRPEWLDTPPLIAHVHDNQNYTRMLPSWYIEHQAEVDELLSGRKLINDLGHWERYGMWIAPDSCPPFCGEEEMVTAGETIRADGHHLKHLFSCGKYWLHPDITNENFDSVILELAALPRGPVNRRGLLKQFPHVGKNVDTCPTSELYADKLAHLTEKLLDYHHDFFSMDIWPLGQPQPCHNPRHNHPPGLGRWYVDANTALIERLQKIAFAREPDAVFGGESMAEPYLPFMHVMLMRSVEMPLVRDKRGRPVGVRIPAFDYLYGDQVQEWNGRTMTQLRQGASEMGLQLARGNLLHITDKWHHKYFDTKAMNMSKDHQPGEPVPTPILRIRLGGPEVRRQNLLFAARANDVQRGEFNPYFSRGRLGRFPKVYAATGESGNWRDVKLYDTHPAIGALKHPTEQSLLWVCVNGKDQALRVRLQRPHNMSLARARHKKTVNYLEWEGASYVEMNLQSREGSLLEWE